MKAPRAFMIQGAGSDVGKSLLVTGLCRAAKKRGLSVAPFKPQNMSNNAAVTADGGEIGRAQALQALASGLQPTVDMNPVLLKPESETGAQIIVQGKRVASLEAWDFFRTRDNLMKPVLESFRRLEAAHDLVIVEGAGGAAEANLRARDIANMGFAEAADVPVVIAGDIERGGVIAQIVGAQAVLAPADARRVKGFVINKFRGDVSLFDDGYAMIEQRTGWRGFGVLPYFADAWRLPAEDALDLRAYRREGGFHIACLVLPRISNFDDLDPLAQEDGVRLTLVGPGRALPGDCDLVILPGSKSTRADLAALKAEGLDIDIRAHVRRGGHVLGICGGYQMLGQIVRDPQGLEGAPGEDSGLGLLDVATTMTDDKRLARVNAIHAPTGAAFSGYEIHLGRTEGPDCARPFAQVEGRPDGAISPDGRVMGAYVHGAFADDAFRRAFLAHLGARPGALAYADRLEATLDALAAHIEAHLDVDGLLRLAR